MTCFVAWQSLCNVWSCHHLRAYITSASAKNRESTALKSNEVVFDGLVYSLHYYGKLPRTARDLNQQEQDDYEDMRQLFDEVFHLKCITGT
ncbi:hypothetical protein QOT17_017628 [Balamuthia mandrillaris]